MLYRLSYPGIHGLDGKDLYPTAWVMTSFFLINFASLERTVIIGAYERGNFIFRHTGSLDCAAAMDPAEVRDTYLNEPFVPGGSAGKEIFPLLNGCLEPGELKCPFMSIGAPTATIALKK